MNAMPVGAPDDGESLAVFVYFRAPLDADARAEAALGRQLGIIRERLGLSGRIGRRVDAGKPYVTWLEIYEEVRRADLAETLEAIDRASTDSGLAALAIAGRHVETFALRR